MTAKEKAQDLTIHFYNVNVNNISSYGMEWKMAKQCALICVEEIIKQLDSLETIFMSEFAKREKYWQEVKEEINRL